tara:strand:+ start:10685 stop:12202 length:1518 start_codon:yes stop_codon:yes gene_type:complete
MDVNNQGLNIPSNLQNLDVRDELLSTESGAGSAGAYSLRDLTGNNLKCVKVRRMQDNAVKDISCGGILTEEVEDFAIGQDVLNMYNSAEYFGVKETNWWSLSGNEIQLGSDPFTITCDFILTDSFGNNTSRVAQAFDGTDFFQFTTSTQFQYKIDGGSAQQITFSPALQLGRKYSFEVSRDSSDHITLKIDGVTMGTNTVTAQNSGNCHIGRIGNFRLLGVVNNYNFNNGEHIIAGDGTETSNWADTGSVGGKSPTKVGSSHTLFTGQGINAFVDTWFDQSGNERHADQSDMDSQPFIIKDGSITTLESKPTLDFNNRGDGTKGGLETSYDISSDGSLTSYSAFAVYDHINATSASVVFSSGSPINASTTYGGLVHFAESSGNGGLIRTSHQTNGNSTITKVTPRSGFHHSVGFNISTNYYSSSSLLCKLLGFTSSENTSPVLPQAKDANDGSLRLGVAITTDGTDTYVNHMNGVISEVIIYESDKRSDNTAFEDNLTSFYGTPS